MRGSGEAALPGCASRGEGNISDVCVATCLPAICQRFCCRPHRKPPARGGGKGAAGISAGDAARAPLAFPQDEGWGDGKKPGAAPFFERGWGGASRAGQPGTESPFPVGFISPGGALEKAVSCTSRRPAGEANSIWFSLSFAFGWSPVLFVTLCLFFLPPSLPPSSPFFFPPSLQ